MDLFFFKNKHLTRFKLENVVVFLCKKYYSKKFSGLLQSMAKKAKFARQIKKTFI